MVSKIQLEPLIQVEPDKVRFIYDPQTGISPADLKLINKTDFNIAFKVFLFFISTKIPR